MSLLNFGFRFDDWGIIPGLPGIQTFWHLRWMYPGKQETQVWAMLASSPLSLVSKPKSSLAAQEIMVLNSGVGTCGGHTTDKNNLEQIRFSWERETKHKRFSVSPF